MPIWREASLSGSSCTRTAYFCDPKTETWATPETIEMRCAKVVSAASSIWGSDKSGELSAMYRIGESAGLTLRKEGGLGISGGNCRCAWEIADCTSRAAPSSERLRSNWMVMLVEPSEFDELIESMPAMVENCFSSGVATEDAMVSGLAPGTA